MIIFELDIQAIPKQSVRQGKGFFYQDTKYLKYSRAIIKEVRKSLSDDFEILDGYLKATVIYVFPPLKGMSKKDKEYLENGGYIYKNTRPDVTDNLNKGLFDALQEVVYVDDSRISEVTASKVFGKQAKIILKIEQLNSKYL